MRGVAATAIGLGLRGTGLGLAAGAAASASALSVLALGLGPFGGFGLGLGRLGVRARASCPEYPRRRGRHDLVGRNDLAFGADGFGHSPVSCRGWPGRVWVAERSGRARSAQGPAANRPPGRSGRLPPAISAPVSATPAPGVRAPLRQSLSWPAPARLPPQTAQPLAKLEIGEKEQADEIEHQENDGRPGGAEVAEEILVEGVSKSAANRPHPRLEVGQAVAIKVQKPGATQEQHHRP